MPPCCLTPFGSPLSTIGTVTVSGLVHRDRVEVGVQQLVVDRIELVLLDEHLAAAELDPVEPDQRVDAGLGVQDPQQQLRVDRNLDRLALLDAVDDRRNAPGRAQAPRLVLAAAVPFFYCEVVASIQFQFPVFQLAPASS